MSLIRNWLGRRPESVHRVQIVVLLACEGKAKVVPRPFLSPFVADSTFLTRFPCSVVTEGAYVGLVYREVRPD